MSEYYKEFYEKVEETQYSAQSVERALKMHFEHPKLMERLITLSLKEPDFNSKNYNPWYEETVDSGASFEDLAIIKEYLKFKKSEEKKKLKKYMKSQSGLFGVSPNYTPLNFYLK